MTLPQTTRVEIELIHSLSEKTSKINIVRYGHHRCRQLVTVQAAVRLSLHVPERARAARPIADVYRLLTIAH